MDPGPAGREERFRGNRNARVSLGGCHLDQARADGTFQGVLQLVEERLDVASRMKPLQSLQLAPSPLGVVCRQRRRRDEAPLCSCMCARPGHVSRRRVRVRSGQRRVRLVFGFEPLVLYGDRASTERLGRRRRTLGPTLPIGGLDGGFMHVDRRMPFRGLARSVGAPRFGHSAFRIEPNRADRSVLVVRTPSATASSAT